MVEQAIKNRKTNTPAPKTAAEPKKKIILWISRHPPLPKQQEQLRQAFGDIELIQFAGFVKDSNHVLELINTYKADEIVVILPYTIIFRLVNEHGIKPIYPEMEEIKNGNTDEVDYEDPGSGRKYKFKRFVRITGVKIITEPI